MAIDLSQAPGEVLLNGNYVWDTGSLSWVKETQSGGGGGGGAVTVADGADVAEGATTDAAVDTDTTGTISGKLRGLVKIAASVWDNINGRIKVDGSGVTQPVSGTVTANISGSISNTSFAATQSGVWTVQPGNTANTTAWKVDGSAVTQPVSNTNIDVALSTRLKAADTLAGVTTVGAVTSITNALPAGTNNIGDVDILTLPIDSYSAKSVVASSSGNNTIHTPSSGNKIRLGYIVLSADGANSADVTATVKFAAGGAALYTISLKAGSMWARNVGAGRRYLDGGTNNALIVSLSTAQTVNVSIEYDEST